MWSIIPVVLVLLTSVNALDLKKILFRGLKEPRWAKTPGAEGEEESDDRVLNEKWLKQPLNHFDAVDNRSWSMRYWQEDKYFQRSGPIFIMLGGESEASPGWLKAGLMHDIAQQHRAVMFQTEHRYYGLSQPTQNLTTENLRYLSADQALADIADFIHHIKWLPSLRESKVIVFGGSYPGNLAAWMRLKYPHLVQGAVASSAPVVAKSDFYEYNEVVTKALKEYGDAECVETTESAFSDLNELVSTEEGAEKIKQIFRLCATPDSKTFSFLVNMLYSMYAGVVQYNSKMNGVYKIQELCKYITATKGGEPLDRLSLLVLENMGAVDLLRNDCLDFNYSDDIVEQSKNALWIGPESMGRQWLFQTCTEFGYYQDSSNSPIGKLLSADYDIDICSDMFGKEFDQHRLRSGIRRTNVVYGGRNPEIKNVVFVNGDLDPWHELSVLEPLNESTHAILIRGASHCQDLQPDYEEDSTELREARQQIKEIVSGWLS